MCVFVCRWVGRCCLSRSCAVKTNSSRSTERWDDKADDCLPPPLCLFPCIPLFLSVSVSPLLFLFIPPNHFQLACHSDRLRLPCIIRPWRFPGHFSGYGEYVSVSSTLSHWQTLYYSMYLSDSFTILKIPVSYTKQIPLVIVILQLAV